MGIKIPVTKRQTIYIAVTAIFFFAVNSYALRQRKVIVRQHKNERLAVMTPQNIQPLFNLEIDPTKVNAAEVYPLLNYYTIASRYFPDIPDAVSLKGFLNYYLGNLDQSIEDYNRASELSPGYFWFQYNLGVLYFRKNEFIRSANAFKQAIEFDQNMTVQFLETRTVIYQQLFNQFENPGKALQKRLSEGFEKAWIYRMIALFNLKEFKQLFNVSQDALKFNLTQRDLVFFFAGVSAYSLKDFKTSSICFEQCTILNKNFGECSYYLGKSFEELGETKKAVDILKESEKLPQLFNEKINFIQEPNVVRLF